MSRILSPAFYPATRIIAWVVLAVMAVSVIYALWMSLANWSWIGV